MKTELLPDFKINENIYNYTTIKTGGLAEYFAQPCSEESLIDIIKWSVLNNKKIIVLGSGSNVIIKDTSLKYVILKLSKPWFSEVTFDSENVTAGAGCSISSLAFKCFQKEFSGMEYFSMIPGTVGGSIAVNAGVSVNGKYLRFNDFVKYTEVIDKTTGLKEIVYPENLNIPNPKFLWDKIIVKAVLKLFKEKKEIIQKRHNSISNYRKKTQDFSNCSCGCVFSNPEGQSAGYLIEKAGLKGRSCGNASVSLKHANFIINNGICNSNEILKLIDIVQKEVFDKFHIFLNKEVEVIE